MKRSRFTEEQIIGVVKEQDVVSDAVTDCRRFRILAVVDDFARECLGLIPNTSISGFRAARGVDQHGDSRLEPKPPR